MDGAGDPWAPPGGTPIGESGWYLASDGTWYPADGAPAPGFWLASDNRWYPANAATEPWRWSGWGFGDVAAGVVAYVLAGLITVAVLATVSGAIASSDDLGPVEVAAFVGANAVAMGGLVCIATLRTGLRSLAADFGLRSRWRDPLVGLGVGIAAVILAALVGHGIDMALGAEEGTSNIPVDRLDGATEVWVFLVAIALVTPVIEELFFRGLVYRSFLKRGRSRRRAVLSTTVVFTLPHLPAAESWIGLVSLIGSIGVLGFALGMACRWTGDRLAAPIVAHMVVNGVATIALIAA